MSDDGVLRVLTVCTHNRTRSVVAAALLRNHLESRQVTCEVMSAGTTSGGSPVTEPAREALAQRNLPLGQHTSTRVTRDMVRRADLVLTAEPDHVVWIAGRWPEAFPRTFTLPEAATLMSSLAVRPPQPWHEWLDAVAQHRPPVRQYLVRDAVASVADPTGMAAPAWETMMNDVDRWCGLVADSVARHARPPDFS